MQFQNMTRCFSVHVCVFVLSVCEKPRCSPSQTKQRWLQMRPVGLQTDVRAPETHGSQRNVTTAEKSHSFLIKNHHHSQTSSSAFISHLELTLCGANVTFAVKHQTFTDGQQVRKWNYTPQHDQQTCTTSSMCH